MSTVLTNGIIIPDNGSRNWGGDLANNWNIIDVNVGYMTDVKNRVTTLENSVAENSSNIEINASNISALQTSKQDTIEDLETIRSGASAGATAVQPSALNNYVDLSSEQTISGSKAFTSVLYAKSIEFNQNSGETHGGYIDFHYAGSTKDYTSRIIESDEGKLNINDCHFRSNSVSPASNNYCDLGTSTNKWKTFNGINPGALSLPKYDQYVTLTFQLNAQIQATCTGFLQVKANVSSGSYLIVTINNLEVASVSPSAFTGHILVPINKDDQIYVTVTSGNYLGNGSLIIFKAQGNV